MTGPFRLLPGPVGDFCAYASAARSSAGHVMLCHDLPRASGSARDVGQTYPALADRLTRETSFRVVAGTLRGAGESAGDFSAQGWVDDLEFLVSTEVPDDAPRWLVGFGFGGVFALHMAANDPLVAGVACLGTPANMDGLIGDPPALVERCLRSGVISTPGYPSAPETWAKELSLLNPAKDAELLRGRPLLVIHGADDPDITMEDARTLADAATGPSDLRVVYGAGHWLRADPRVIAILVGWLERRR
ncbi:MAG TPA: alpha/beta hydrolase [Acidimicrobiales bacterium]